MHARLIRVAVHPLKVRRENFSVYVKVRRAREWRALESLRCFWDARSLQVRTLRFRRQFFVGVT